MKDINRHIIIGLSVPLFMVVIITSLFHYLQPDLYANETANWQAQSLGQDITDLYLMAPLFLVISIWVIREKGFSILVWAGFNFYFFYTYLIYAFTLHFNEMFLLYCLALGLSFYSLIYFTYLVVKRKDVLTKGNSPIAKAVGFFFIVTTSIFGVLWTAEIIPALAENSLPSSLMESGLFTNPVHVLDLSILLPGAFAVGIAILRNNYTGLILAPMILTFFILMDITIGILVLVMLSRNIEVNVMIAYIMTVLAIFSIILLAVFIRNKSIKISEESSTKDHEQSNRLYGSSWNYAKSSQAH